MSLYVGAKIIHGEPMNYGEYAEKKQLVFRVDEADKPGYMVTYPDGYVSWSPKAAFENAYRLVTPGEIDLVRPWC